MCVRTVCETVVIIINAICAVLYGILACRIICAERVRTVCESVVIIINTICAILGWILASRIARTEGIVTVCQAVVIIIEVVVTIFSFIYNNVCMCCGSEAGEYRAHGCTDDDGKDKNRKRRAKMLHRKEGEEIGSYPLDRQPCPATVPGYL